MIPKKIHYCWFGGAEKPALAKKCIASWKKYCPDYEIIEWNEGNFDIKSSPIYVQQAYEQEKWAFVTDYVRLYVVFQYGGIYLDTDVEIIKKIDDLLTHPAYFAFEDENYVATGLGFGAKKNNIILKELIRDYEKIRFIDERGKMDLTPCPVRNTKVIKKYVNSHLDANVINYTADAVFFPKKYFSPLDAATRKLEIEKETYSIHWFSASWYSEKDRVYHDYRVFSVKCKNIFGEKMGRWIVRTAYFVLWPKERKILKEM